MNKRRAVLCFLCGVLSATLYSCIDRSFATWKPEYAQADPAVQAWYRNAKLTPEAAARLGFTSCCAHSDVVKTHFRVNKKDGGDEWWWLDDDTWRRVPADIIHWGESAPDGQPTLFANAGTPTCFYPGESGN